MSDAGSPGGALAFLANTGESPPARAMAFRVLERQQADVHDAFRAGFGSVGELVEWLHAASAVSLGYVDDEWVSSVVGDWWLVAGLLDDADRRQALTEHPPARPAMVRERQLREHLLPAFNSAVAFLRANAETHAEQDVERAGQRRQRFLAMRPRVHQVAVAQHRLLRRALGAPEADPIATQQDLTDWARAVVQVTTGAVSSEWLRTVTRPTSLWATLLTGDSGRAMLYALVASDLLPAMNAALHDAAQRGSEEIEDPTGVDQSPLEVEF
jgi:hypothetical protein